MISCVTKVQFPDALDAVDFNISVRSEIHSVIHILQAGTRKNRQVLKPALPELLKRALLTGSASMFISENNILKRIVVKKVDNFNFTLERDLLSAFSPEELQVFRTIGLNFPGVLEKVAELLTPLHNVVNRIGLSSKHISEILLHDQKNTFSLQLRIKDDATVSLGIGRIIAIGSFKTIFKFFRIGTKISSCIEGVLINQKYYHIFKRECEMTQKFQSDHIVKLRHYTNRTILSLLPTGVFNEITYQMLMKTEEYQAGSARIFTKTPPTNPEDLFNRFQIMCHTGKALKFLHESGFAHMDVKPGNIFIQREASGFFGVLGDLNPYLEGEYAKVTTLQYADLDLIQEYQRTKKFLCNRSVDVWALGQTLFNVIFGSYNNPFMDPIDFVDSQQFEKVFLLRHQVLLLKLQPTRICKLIKNFLQLNRIERPKVVDEILLREFETILEEIRPQIREIA